MSVKPNFNLHNILNKLYLSHILYNREVFMRIVNFSEARNHLKSVLDQVVEDVDFTVISRRDADEDRKSVV